MSLIYCYKFLYLITASVVVFLIACAVVGLVITLVVIEKKSSTKTSKGKVYTVIGTIILSTITAEADNVVHDMKLPDNYNSDL